jgi:hypothetical protein
VETHSVEKSRVPYFLDNRLTDGAPAALYTQEDSWYSFLLEAESTPSHSAAGMIRSIEKSSDLIGNQTRDLQACNIVPQPSTLPRDKVFKSGDVAMHVDAK